MQEIIKSKKFVIAAVIISVFVIALFSFSLGMAVGFKKAKFSYNFGENYERNFAGPRPEKGDGRMGGFPFPRGFEEFEKKEFRNAHGLAGEIISIADGNLIVKDRDEKENTVQVSDKTLIKRGKETIQIGDLKIGDKIVVVGRPSDNGVINADLLRIFDDNNTSN
jgi:hypothetical protein